MTAKAVRKPLRADAERNRQKVLEVAQDVFAAEGLGVPIDEIARRAGLGVGTLYRHFPTKEALFEAIVIGRMQALVDEATAALEEEKDAGEAFFATFERVIEEGGRKKDFIDALSASGSDFARVRAVKEDLHAVIARLLKRAQRARAVRRDVDPREVMALAMGAVSAFEKFEVDVRGRERLLRVLRDGLRGRDTTT